VLHNRAAWLFVWSSVGTVNRLRAAPGLTRSSLYRYNGNERLRWRSGARFR